VLTVKEPDAAGEPVLQPAVKVIPTAAGLSVAVPTVQVNVPNAVVTGLHVPGADTGVFVTAQV